MRVRYEAAAGTRGSSSQQQQRSATAPQRVGRVGAIAFGPRRATTMRLLLLCSALAVSTLLLLAHSPTTLGGGSGAGSSEAFVQRLQHLQATSASRVASQYGIAAGYWQLDLNYSAPAEVPLLARPRYAASNASCWALASRHAEAFSSAYEPTQQPPTALPGGVPRAAWQWQGRISRQLFASVPFLLRDKQLPAGTREPPCQHCTFVLRYKVIGGQLYTDSSRRHRSLMGAEKEAAITEELLLAALYMYKVPDVDFLLHLGDGCPGGLPLVQVNINRGNSHAGFTIPLQMWAQALGPQQFALLAECLQARYPPRPARERIARAVWRGSNTDPAVLLMDESSVLDVMRTRLHLFGRWFPQLFDAHFTGFPQQAFSGNCIGELLPPGPELPLEEFNRFALLLDIDGNGWSDRYRLFAHFNTPVLKQASNLTAFFEHLAAPGGAVVEHYAPDLSDLPARAAALLQELGTQPERLLRMAERQQGLAAYALNQAALMHATAYTLATVARLNSWQADPREPGYELVPFARCCSHAANLPRVFVRGVKAWGAKLGQQEPPPPPSQQQGAVVGRKQAAGRPLT